MTLKYGYAEIDYANHQAGHGCSYNLNSRVTDFSKSYDG